MGTRVLIAVFVGTLVSLSSIQAGTIEVIDQEHVFTVNGGPPDYDFGVGIAGFAPVGQSFTPRLSALNAVEVRVSDFFRNGLGAVLQIRLYDGEGIAGSPFALSNTVAIPDGFAEWFGGETVCFFFPAQASLVPGNRYTFEIHTVLGDNLITYYRRLGGYPDGVPIFDGLPSIYGDDMWFREGLVPEPSTALMMLAGLVFICLHYAEWRRHSSCRRPAR